MINAMKLAMFVSAGFAVMTSATQVHVNSGCIVVGTQPICATDHQTIAYIDGGAANIYARFDGVDRTSSSVPPGCVLGAAWPSDYGDIYFGNDNCLYDATGNNIGGQCCVPGTANGVTVVNPYLP